MVARSNRRGFLEAAEIARLRQRRRCGADGDESQHARNFRARDCRESPTCCTSAARLLYLDGANMNALLGVAKPGHMGADIVQLNLHKTFSTPHGGGGPGAGPVAVKQHLDLFCPCRACARAARPGASTTIGPTRSGGFADFTAISGCWCAPTLSSSRSAAMGSPRQAGFAILTANYVRKRLEPTFRAPRRSRRCTNAC